MHPHRTRPILCRITTLFLLLGLVPAAIALAGEPLTLDFPRLGMWWPDPWQQSLDDIARYDYVILGWWAAEFIEPLKQRNPDILLLTSTNACELAFDADPDAEPWQNQEVLAIPPEWFLTQVGSTLLAAVNATTPTLRVERTRITSGDETIDLFVEGDAVLIEGETVMVEAVNHSTQTLTVQRGYVRPAAAHQAGVRVAAHITFWPGSWLFNLSTMCPEAVADSEIGAETWAEYNARQAIDLVQRDDWDGILLDRSDPDESWLIGNSTARTIDPDQSNTLLEDYAAFDQSWNTGLRQYETLLRTAIGDEQIIFVNWGMANYDLLNGNNFEGFPRDEGSSHGLSWATMVLGPYPNGSYFEWMAQSRQPNLTMIETYEDDDGPDPTSDGSYNNPCAQPGFVPNYRKMRFGLGTALLEDGFFSYEINTNGHGSLCLLWFDEYDNAGQRRGYLGQPTGPAVRLLADPGTPDLVAGGFEQGLAGWDLWADPDGYAATAAIDRSTAAEGSASLRVDVTASAGTDWRVSLYASPLSVVANQEYTLTFWAKATAARSLLAWVQQEEPPWEGWLTFSEVTLTTEWQRFELTATCQGNDPAAGLYFGLGATTGTVWLDGVHLQQGSPQLWRRDFDHGTVLVNATTIPSIVTLDSPLRHIRGTQAPAVNTGERVLQVTVPPTDAIILLKERFRQPSGRLRP